MAADNFWNNREAAQKIIDEANTLRGKIEPLLQAEKQLEDVRVMIELGEAEPPAAQAKMRAGTRTRCHAVDQGTRRAGTARFFSMARTTATIAF